MNSWLAPFSDWTLALLPRLFLYPGGLWALLMLLVLRFFSGGLQSAGLPAGLRAVATDLSRSQLATATAWATLALLPLPGAAPLPFPADRFSLAGLLVTSLVLSWHSRGMAAATNIPVNIAITLAVMAPLAGGHTLMQTGAEWGVSGWLALAAVAVGLIALSSSTHSLAAGLRWLAWFGLGAAPVWAAWTPSSVPDLAWVSLVYLVALVALTGASRTRYVHRNQRALLITCWGLGALALLLALVFGVAR